LVIILGRFVNIEKYMKRLKKNNYYLIWIPFLSSRYVIESSTYNILFDAFFPNFSKMDKLYVLTSRKSDLFNFIDLEAPPYSNVILPPRDKNCKVILEKIIELRESAVEMLEKAKTNRLQRADIDFFLVRFSILPPEEYKKSFKMARDRTEIELSFLIGLIEEGLGLKAGKDYWIEFCDMIYYPIALRISEDVVAYDLGRNFAKSDVYTWILNRNEKILNYILDLLGFEV